MTKILAGQRLKLSPYSFNVLLYSLKQGVFIYYWDFPIMCHKWTNYWSLKNNRSCDGNGISAEHLKYGGKPVSIFIAQVLNSVFRYGKVPEMFKMGYITPIYKKQGNRLVLSL